MESKIVDQKHLWIPDPQVKPNVPLEHLSWLGHYIVEKKPNTVVCAGDFADMPSLSSYDAKGSKEYEGKRYKADIEAAYAGMDALMSPLRNFNAKAKVDKHAQYHPRLVMLEGNHENRITRAINADPQHLEGLISLDDLPYREYGWEFIPFLHPIIIDGIGYSHYWPHGKKGLPISSARALLTKKHMTCVAGHQQGRDIAYDKRGDGKVITGIIAGSYYLHDEAYMDFQSNEHWRGIYVFHEVNDGSFDEMAVSLAYLRKRYSGKAAA